MLEDCILRKCVFLINNVFFGLNVLVLFLNLVWLIVYLFDFSSLFNLFIIFSSYVIICYLWLLFYLEFVFCCKCFIYLFIIY